MTCFQSYSANLFCFLKTLEKAIEFYKVLAAICRMFIEVNTQKIY
ncbi:24004_t:CDS:2 [Gigaspora margarita]|uniref:24004_t:CDS:1 n=1 Tax=Gigaspora margarita TaxID=4874 RepID=A0ABM8W1Q7_GIGMA|nr:24004_t:CDS:2 [Gigaspora margarita]